MRTNGYIEFSLTAPSGFDETTGLPVIPDKTEWGEKIACLYQTNSCNRLGRVNGESFTIASHTILLEQQPLPDSFRLRLYDKDGTRLGEYSLISQPQYLSNLGRIKILV